MIQSKNYKWFLFKDLKGHTAGCFTYHLNFYEKKGYMRGFILKKKYFGQIDVVKTTIACMVKIWRRYKDQIYVWYAENRTAHAKAQYMAVACGIMPIAFFPNKDVFEGKVESDIMHIIYDKKALTELRSKKVPQILTKAAYCFFYANMRYDLGKVKFETPFLDLDHGKLVDLAKYLMVRIEKDRFGYENITFYFENSASKFSFLYTPQVQNFEKTVYTVKNIEELFVFIQEFKKFMTQYKIRYSECFVSAYLPEHQKLFYDEGFMPRGYIPSWNYNYKTKVFEDHIVFNQYKGEVSENLQLVKQAEDLILVLREP